jgi:hypothetical protein
MKKGQSYSTLTDANTKHPLVKKLHRLGATDIHLVYASHMATDAGWTLLTYKCDKRLPTWLGYTISESLKKLNEL